VEKSCLVISLGSLRSDFNSGSFTYGIPTDRHIELHSNHTQIQHAYYPDIGFKHRLPKLTERLSRFHDIGSEIPVEPFKVHLPSDATQEITQRFFWPRLSTFFQPSEGAGFGTSYSFRRQENVTASQS
jgi:pyruvate decarboxylase